MTDNREGEEVDRTGNTPAEPAPALASLPRQVGVSEPWQGSTGDRGPWLAETPGWAAASLEHPVVGSHRMAEVQLGTWRRGTCPTVLGGRSRQDKNKPVRVRMWQHSAHVVA